MTCFLSQPLPADEWYPILCWWSTSPAAFVHVGSVCVSSYTHSLTNIILSSHVVVGASVKYELRFTLPRNVWQEGTVRRGITEPKPLLFLANLQVITPFPIQIKFQFKNFLHHQPSRLSIL